MFLNPLQHAQFAAAVAEGIRPLQVQLAQFTVAVAEWIRPQFEFMKKIEHFVEILFGNINGTPPASLQKFLEKYGIPKEQSDRMTLEEKIKAFLEIGEKQTTKGDNILVALDMIFEARYGWPEGTVANITLADIFLALEHATDYDDPSKPSIWEITK